MKDQLTESAEKFAKKLLDDLGLTDLMMPIVGKAVDQLEGAYDTDGDGFDGHKSCKLLVFRHEDFVGLFERNPTEKQKHTFRSLSPSPEKYMIGVYRRARRDLELQFGFALPSVKGGGVVNMSVFVDFEDSRQAEYSVRPEFPMDMPAEEIDAISMWYSLKT